MKWVCFADFHEVFRVSCGEEKLLLRIYGSTEHGIFKREDEAVVFLHLVL